jgi:quercetin dioxygenase-like cupin family protein
VKKLICTAAAAAALIVTGVAAAAQPITAQPLAAAKLAKSFSFTTKPGDLVFVRVTIQPGGDFGWHTHRSPVAVAVLSGTLTLYDSSNKSCAPHPVPAGEGFVEQANHVHLARNDGKTPARVLVAYLGAPHGESPDVPAATPAQCSSVR